MIGCIVILIWNHTTSRHAKKAIFPHINCDDCERQLEKSEFIAIIGKVPSTGLSMPMGRADAIFEKMGKIYCEQCFKKRYESKS
jgi:hypothetical protein